MTPSHSLPALKQQAKALRTALAEAGQPVSHSRSLELLARQHGYRDWNTLHAQAGNETPPAFAPGQRIAGHYLGQAFEGEIVGVRMIAERTRFRLAVRFDVPVDVITFEGMSNFRSLVHVVVDAGGQSAEKTSDGRPHLQIDMRRAAV